MESLSYGDTDNMIHDIKILLQDYACFSIFFTYREANNVLKWALSLNYDIV